MSEVAELTIKEKSAVDIVRNILIEALSDYAKKRNKNNIEVGLRISPKDNTFIPKFELFIISKPEENEVRDFMGLLSMRYKLLYGLMWAKDIVAAIQNFMNNYCVEKKNDYDKQVFIITKDIKEKITIIPSYNGQDYDELQVFEIIQRGKIANKKD